MAESAPALAQAWADAWSKDDSDGWTQLYTSDATYIDHAYGIKRKGQKSLRNHHESWRKAIPDYDAKIVHEWKLDENRYSFRFRSTGTLKEALPYAKATGKSFESVGSVDFVVEEKDGKWYISSENTFYGRPGEVDASNYKSYE